MLKRDSVPSATTHGLAHHFISRSTHACLQQMPNFSMCLVHHSANVQELTQLAPPSGAVQQPPKPAWDKALVPKQGALKLRVKFAGGVLIPDVSTSIRARGYNGSCLAAVLFPASATTDVHTSEEARAPFYLLCAPNCLVAC